MRTPRFLSLLLMIAVFPPFQGPDRPNTDRPDRDPPGRVGRLSFVTGSVSFRPGDVDDWVSATVNYPLHNGDHLWTDSDGRAEITVGSTAFRLAPLSAFGFLALDDRFVQVRLSQGSLNVRVRDLRDDESLEIDTPSGAVSLLRTGVYRVDVDTTGDTTSVTVRNGEAEVTDTGSAFPVRREQTALVVGGDSPSYDVQNAIRSDDWEDWCASRDRRWDDSRSARYVSRGVIGYEDLGGSGVACFPLAPEEPYVPAYRVSNTYIRNVNVTNVNVTNINVTNVNVTNINYRNRRERDGVTVVSHETFVESRPVNREVIVVPRDRLDQAGVVGATARVAPGRRSVLGQPAIVEARRPPMYGITRQVALHRKP